MKAPYLKLYKEVKGFKVYIVDGGYVRKNMNAEFTNFGQHLRFPFIPANEFWIDNSKEHKEYKYFIEHMLVEHDQMKKGKSFNYATTIARRVESKHRHENESTDRSDPHIALLKEQNGLKIFLVDGNIVRSKYFVDFTEGGHGKVYGFIPPDEVWIDNLLPVSEREPVIFHECHEKELMDKGMDYHKAHHSSMLIEKKLRLADNPKRGFIDRLFPRATPKLQNKKPKRRMLGIIRK